MLSDRIAQVLHALCTNAVIVKRGECRGECPVRGIDEFSEVTKSGSRGAAGYLVPLIMSDGKRRSFTMTTAVEMTTFSKPIYRDSGLEEDADK